MRAEFSFDSDPSFSNFGTSFLIVLSSVKKKLDDSINLSESENATQLCPTLCDPMGCSPPCSSVLGILQQEYWSGLPFPSPGDLLDPGVEPRSPALQADCLPSEPPGKPPNPYMLLIEIPIEDCGRRGQ